MNFLIDQEDIDAADKEVTHLKTDISFGESSMRNTHASGGSDNVALAIAKDTRVELRTSLDIKEKLRAAASLAGVDMSAFILMAATQAAQRIISEEYMRVVNASEWAKLNEILNTSHQPGDKLRNLMTRAPKYERKF